MLITDVLFWSDPEIKALRENISLFRRRNNLTQKELGNLMGYTAAYVSKLEKGACAASMAVLQKLSKALEVSVADLLTSGDTTGKERGPATPVPVLNSPASGKLISPVKHSKPLAGQCGTPSALGIASRDSFALYLADDSMAPEFGKGDLVVFSLTRKPADGQACLVDRGKGQILFRTVLALPGKQWRLQPVNPRFSPVVVKAGKGLRMWPAIGYWRMLGSRRGPG